jgi:hypothetical protein
MRKFTAFALLAVSLALSGCGAGSHANGNINGLWSATLSNSTLANDFIFMTNLTVNADGSLGTTSFNLTLNNTPCTFTTTTESGSFTIEGNFNGQVSGKFQYLIMSTGVEVNTLTLNGTVQNGQIMGTWSVSGAVGTCTGSGTFTMNPVLAPGLK